MPVNCFIFILKIFKDAEHLIDFSLSFQILITFSLVQYFP